MAENNLITKRQEKIIAQLGGDVTTLKTNLESERWDKIEELATGGGTGGGGSASDLDVKIDLATATNISSSSTLGNVVKKACLTNAQLAGKTSLDGKFGSFKALEEVDIDMKGITSAQNCFSTCPKLTNSGVKLRNTQDLKDATRMFNACTGLTETIEFDTSSLTHMYAMYYGCTNIKTMKPMDFSSAISVSGFFNGMTNLQNIEEITNLGKGFTEKTELYSDYKVDLTVISNLTHDAVMAVINGLADLNEVYDVANGGTLYTQCISLGTAHKSKVSSAEKQIAKDKGWTVLE